MKLYNDKLSNLKLILIITMLCVDAIGFFIILMNFRPVLIKTMERSLSYSINRTNIAINTFNSIIRGSFDRYSNELKLIGKYLSLINYDNDANKYINKDNQYFMGLHSNPLKSIVFAEMSQLKLNPAINNFYNDKNYNFDYISHYSESINIDVVFQLFDATLHPELSTIAYYKPNGNIEMINSDFYKTLISKYSISIFNNIFVGRYLLKQSKTEYLRILMIVEDEFYIYPPEAYNNTYLYYISQFLYFDCGNETKTGIKNFPKCVYDYINSRDHEFACRDQGFMRPILFESRLFYENFIIDYCLTVPFLKSPDLYDLSYNPIACLELNMTKVFSEQFFNNQKAVEIIFYYLKFDEIKTLFYGKNDEYEEIKNCFSDDKFGEYKININNENINDYKSFSLFHFLYYDIFKEEKYYNNTLININNLIVEFENISNIIFNETAIVENKNRNAETVESIQINIQKTTCYDNLYDTGTNCLKDDFIFLIHPLYVDFSLLDENYLIDKEHEFSQPLFFTLAILNNNNIYIQDKIRNIIFFKIMKLFAFYFILSIFIIIIYEILLSLYYNSKFDFINQVITLIKNNFSMDKNNKDKNNIPNILTCLSSIEANNKEMIELKKLLEYICQLTLLKKNIETNNNESCNNKDFMDIIKNISDPETKLMGGYIVAYNHFQSGSFKLCEDELKNLLNEMKEYEEKLKKENELDDNKIKDAICRSSDISYLNEYSFWDKINQSLQIKIKPKILKQRIMYLYGFSIYNQQKEEKNNQKLFDAISAFNECKKINDLLNMNHIKKITFLIMIARCHIKMDNYKETLISLNHALSLYEESFKIKINSSFCPKVMLFTENYIFQNIMFTIAQIAYIHKKYFSAGWILLKIFETSPFILCDVHYHGCIILSNCLKFYEKSLKIDKVFEQLKLLDKYKKLNDKIFARLDIKLEKEKSFHKELILKNYINTSNYNNSSTNNVSNSAHGKFSSNIYKRSKNYRKSDTIKKNVGEISMNSAISGKPQQNLYDLVRNNRKKNITFFISEKILTQINGEDFEYFLVKYLRKYFSNNDNDKFGFIQFSSNGKKTIELKSLKLNEFISKLQKAKEAFQANINYNTNSNVDFLEFYNLLNCIVNKNLFMNSAEELIDNIIIMFMSSDDIRFTSKEQCTNIIRDLNEKNYSLYIFCCESNIKKRKISNIISLLAGLFDAHFFKYKNFQQVKQLLLNFSINKFSQEKFLNFDFDCFDNTI